jgi:hypothetical protein
VPKHSATAALITCGAVFSCALERCPSACIKSQRATAVQQF